MQLSFVRVDCLLFFVSLPRNRPLWEALYYSRAESVYRLLSRKCVDNNVFRNNEQMRRGKVKVV